jgi:hypothetical protein
MVFGAAVAGPGVRSLSGATFLEKFATPTTRPIGAALADSIGRALPVIAASPGLSFSFDPATHVFRRETAVLGQLYLERARPLGRGKWNLALDYQWVRIDTVDGQDLDHLSDTRLPIVDPDNGRPFTIPRFGLDLETHQVTTSLTYGVTDDLDLNLTVPVVSSALGLDVVFRDVATGRVQRDRLRDSAFGAGDIFLRGKYRFAHGALGDLAAGLVLRLPAGNEENFQGTGSFEAGPMLYAATPAVRVGGPFRLQGYANAGVDLNAEDVGASQGRFGVGVDCGLAARVTFAVAFLGREPFRGIAPPGFFDVERIAPGSGVARPVLGLERDRASVYDLSVGGRVNLWRDTLIGFANVLLPLNDEGFRSDVIPLVGLEATF